MNHDALIDFALDTNLAGPPQNLDERSNSMEKSSFLGFIRLVIDGDLDGVSRRLRSDPALATMASPIGATRQDAADYFFTEISHYIYAGDTALHMAAAAFSRSMAGLLV